MYDPAGGHWYFQWFTVLFLAATVAVGAGFRLYRNRVVGTGSPAPETVVQEATV